ncbi:MAG: hypothetical protein J1E65_09905 [Lachnospiraceae bacterium]|nr:hypothetical protein [Lachnospiraceae bacterium]
MHENKEQLLQKKLEQVQSEGVSLFLEGEPATPAAIAGKCVCENMIYMADYVLDDNGALKELRYDRITDW